jgi:hypothetical protein
MHDESLIAAKQPVDARCGRVVNAEKIARYVACGHEFAGQRRVDAMIVVWREIYGGKISVDIMLGFFLSR